MSAQKCEGCCLFIYINLEQYASTRTKLFVVVLDLHSSVIKLSTSNPTVSKIQILTALASCVSILNESVKRPINATGRLKKEKKETYLPLYMSKGQGTCCSASCVVYLGN